MPNNSSDTNKKYACDRFGRHTSVSDQKYIKPKRVIASKKTIAAAEGRSCSAGKLDRKPASSRSKKSSQSDSVVAKREQYKLCPGCCHKCGDTSNQEAPFDRLSNTSSAIQRQHKHPSLIIHEDKKVEHGVQQYFRNENFNESSGSIRVAKTPRPSVLDPINENTEYTTKDSGDIVIITESEDSDGCVDFEDHESLLEIKKFREKYFFECHNSKSRVKSKCGSSNSENHKCVYRFYLNDRLFPVPLCTDHKNTIRCVECHLPLEEREESSEINGTIQAKVMIHDDDEAQDMTLFLPVKDALIVREKRQANKDKQNEEILYFGVVKLNRNGDSVFEPNTPSNSLALRYQKGYKEHKKADSIVYGPSENGKVIIL